MIEAVVERWHRFLSGDDPEGLAEITTLYLQAAQQTLPGDPGGEGAFRYAKQVLADDTVPLQAVDIVHEQMRAMLEAMRA